MRRMAYVAILRTYTNVPKCTSSRDALVAARNEFERRMQNVWTRHQQRCWDEWGGEREIGREMKPEEISKLGLVEKRRREKCLKMEGNYFLESLKNASWAEAIGKELR
jgi:hypothetical protein